jgi:hypothetical protein
MIHTDFFILQDQALLSQYKNFTEALLVREDLFYENLKNPVIDTLGFTRTKILTLDEYQKTLTKNKLPFDTPVDLNTKVYVTREEAESLKVD